MESGGNAIPIDVTMDELEADIQRRLNLIKESLAKMDAPVSSDTINPGNIPSTVFQDNIKLHNQCKT